MTTNLLHLFLDITKQILTAGLDQHYTNIDWCWGQHWKMSRSCAMLPEGQRSEGNITLLLHCYYYYYIFFLCWSRLTVNICFVILRNECNKIVSSCTTQQRGIRIDLPNTEIGLKNRRKWIVSRGLHHVSREHGSRDAMFHGNITLHWRKSQNYIFGPPCGSIGGNIRLYLKVLMQRNFVVDFHREFYS